MARIPRDLFDIYELHAVEAARLLGARLSLLKQEAARVPAAASPAASPAAHVRMAFAVLLPLLAHQADVVRLVVEHYRRAMVLDKVSRLEAQYAELSRGAHYAIRNLMHEEAELWSVLRPGTRGAGVGRQAFAIDVRTRDHCANVLSELSLLKQEVARFRQHLGARRNAQVGARDSLKTLLSSIHGAQTSWQRMLGRAQADVDWPCYLIPCLQAQ